MSKILERMTQQINPAKWMALEEIDKKYDAVESKLGFYCSETRRATDRLA